MDKLQRIALVHSNAIAALIEAMGATAENAQRKHLGHSMAYDDAAFSEILVRYELRPDIVKNFLVHD